MGDNVRLRHFGDCARLVRDTCNPTDVPPLTPYIGLEHIPENDLHLSDYGFAGDVASTKTKFKKEDILFGKLRPYFRKVIIAPFDGVCSTDIWVVRAKKEVDQKYLFYWMASHEFVDQATQGSEGTKMPRAKWEYISRFEQPVPSLPEQHFIAEVLGALDDKIELNRRMNATLESMARAVFKAWFVDSEEAKGWKVGILEELADLNPEAWSNKSAPSQVEYIDLSNTKWGTIEETIIYSWKDAPSRARRILRPGDTILGTVRPGNGSYALITRKGLTGSTGFAVLRPKSVAYREYVYLATTSKENIEWFAHLADGAAYPAIRPEIVISSEIARPPDEILEKFSTIAKPLMDKIASNDEQSRTLAALRDALLPRLMRGEVRIAPS